jgi:hypothetical protein
VTREAIVHRIAVNTPKLPVLAFVDIALDVCGAVENDSDSELWTPLKAITFCRYGVIVDVYEPSFRYDGSHGDEAEAKERTWLANAWNVITKAVCMRIGIEPPREYGVSSRAIWPISGNTITAVRTGSFPGPPGTEDDL